jgi:hypothetical protein
VLYLKENSRPVSLDIGHIVSPNVSQTPLVWESLALGLPFFLVSSNVYLPGCDSCWSWILSVSFPMDKQHY